jgi:hypothetical protein
MSAVTDISHSVMDTMGLTDYAGQEEARAIAAQNSANAKAASDRSYALTKEQLDFQRKQYDDWKNIYGPLQEDLGTYFKNLNGDNLAAKQIEAIQRESQQAQTNVDQQLAQRGLSQSGLTAEALMRNQATASMAKANVRANADQLAAQQKMGFLGLGLGQGTQMLGINANVSNNGASSAIGAMGSFAGMSNSALGVGAQLSMANIGSNQFLLDQSTDIAGAMALLG